MLLHVLVDWELDNAFRWVISTRKIHRWQKILSNRREFLADDVDDKVILNFRELFYRRHPKELHGRYHFDVLGSDIQGSDKCDRGQLRNLRDAEMADNFCGQDLAGHRLLDQ